MANTNNDLEYYENSTKWGRNGISLENVIDNILITADDDSYFKKSMRSSAIIFGKQCLKNLDVNLERHEKMIAIQLAPHLTFPFPRFMAQWFRISVLNECKKLTELAVKNSDEINDYLQDDQYRLLYDDHGNVLQGSSFNAEHGNCIDFDCKPCQDPDYKNSECSDSKRFVDSWVKEEKQAGYFSFSGDLVDRIIVIEYQELDINKKKICDIQVDDFIELTLESYIRWKLLEGKRNTPQGEAVYFYNNYKREKKISERRLGKKISVNNILTAMANRTGI